jgi:diguanylate cyclase (GGDEF)-like protein
MKQFTANNLKLNNPVKDFMIKDPYTAEITDNVKEAIELMVSNKIGSIIIVNSNKKPINILTRTDILKLIFFNYTDITIKDALKILKKEKVKLFTINENDPITDCIEIFVSKGIKHLPVVNSKNEVIGVISATDIIQKVSYLIFIDNLTGFGNRHYFESLKVKLHKFHGKITTGLLMLDIDNFKRINDTYGHTFGDKVLKKVAETIIDNIRFVDEAVRYGGEEFLIILFKAHQQVVLKIGERIRQAVERIRFEEHPELRVTISIGATLCLSTSNIEECIKRADLALKKAKKEGKNRVVFTPPRRHKPLKSKDFL